MNIAEGEKVTAVFWEFGIFRRTLHVRLKRQQNGGNILKCYSVDYYM